MSEQRIDSIARIAASGMGRRNLVKSLGAAAFGAAGLVALRGADPAVAGDESDLNQCIDRCRSSRCAAVKHQGRCRTRCKDRCQKRIRG